MKTTKKVFAMLLCLAMLFTLCSCGQDDTAKFIGTWEAEIDMTEQMVAGIEEGLADMVDYFEFGSFLVTATYIFNEDGTYSLGMALSDESIAGLAESVRAGLNDYLLDYYNYIAAMSGMTMDEFIEAYNAEPDENGEFTTFDDDLALAVEEAMVEMDLESMVSEMLADAQVEGKWKVKDGKIFSTEDVDDEFKDGDYDVYENLTEDSFTLVEGYVDGEAEDTEGDFFPITFERVA